MTSAVTSLRRPSGLLLMAEARDAGDDDAGTLTTTTAAGGGGGGSGGAIGTRRRLTPDTCLPTTPPPPGTGSRIYHIHPLIHSFIHIRLLVQQLAKRNFAI